MRSQRLLSPDRTLRACTYTGTSTETQAEDHSPGLKALSLEPPLSIMDCYRDDAFRRLEMGGGGSPTTTNQGTAST
ncbi:unnamed protein product [Gadus morhua 'NCC']